MLAGGFGLLAYAAVDREPGPGYLGVVALAGAVLLIGRPDPDAELVFWPLFLLLIGLAGVGLGLRPRKRLPPEPGEPAPTTPLHPDEPTMTRRLWSEEDERR